MGETTNEPENQVTAAELRGCAEGCALHVQRCFSIGPQGAAEAQPFREFGRMFEAAAQTLDTRDARIAELEAEVEGLEERIEQVESDASQAIQQVRHQGHIAHREAQERADQARMDLENTQARLRRAERERR